MTKRIMGLLLVATMMLGLTACGRTPSEQVKKTLKDFKSSELGGGELNLDESGLDKEILDKYVKVLEKEKEFNFKIKSEEIAEDEKSAVVTVTITTYDFGLAYLDTWDEIIASGNREEKVLYNTMFDKMLALDTKTYTKDVAINCTLKDGKWKTDIAKNTAFKNAIFGGVPELVQEFANL